MIGYEFTEYAKRNKSSNEAMNSIIEQLSEDEWKKDFSGYYKSIYELCSHIYSTDYNWFKRFVETCNFSMKTNNFFEKGLYPERQFKTAIFPGVKEYISMRNELDETIIKYIGKLSEEDLKKIVIIPDTDDKVFELELGPMIFYMFNHQTHHRGMISLYLDMLGKENDYC